MTVVDERDGAGARATRRAGLRRFLHGLSSVLIVAGLLLLADAGLTVAWQEPLSALYAKVEQGKLRGQLDDLQSTIIATPAEKRALKALPDESRRIAFAARAMSRKAANGHPVGRIRIPAIGVSQVIVQGTDTDDLRKGPGHYPSTPLPGAPGTVGIAGHRTTYGAPFRRVNQLHKGDRITVQMPYATITYRVERLRIVDPTALWVVDRRSYDRLVLTACHPLYSAAKRIVVFARKESEKASSSLR
jgi:sortase A